MFCRYFQAHIVSHNVWFVTSVLRSCDHLVFDRTIDVRKSIFEFFVPSERAEQFVALIHIFQEKNIVTMFVELPNRLRFQDVYGTQLHQELQ